MKIKIGDTLRIADCESMRYSSGGCRVGKDILEDAVERLKEYSDDELPIELQDTNFSVPEIEAILRRCLEDSDPDNDYVRFSWF